MKRCGSCHTEYDHALTECPHCGYEGWATFDPLPTMTQRPVAVPLFLCRGIGSLLCGILCFVVWIPQWGSFWISLGTADALFLSGGGYAGAIGGLMAFCVASLFWTGFALSCVLLAKQAVLEGGLWARVTARLGVGLMLCSVLLVAWSIIWERLGEYAIQYTSP